MLTSLVTVGWLLAGGCTGQPTAPPVATAPPVSSAPSTAPKTCPVPEFGTADAAAVLVPGPSNGLPRSDAKGDLLVVDGVVVDGSCTRAAAAELNIWHTDARGDYRPPGTDRCCFYQGQVLTDQHGRFRLETVRPGQYSQPNAPPAHVHFEIRHGTRTLVTEITFVDRPGAPSIGSASVIPVNLSQSRREPHTVWSGKVAFVLPGLT